MKFWHGQLGGVAASLVLAACGTPVTAYRVASNHPHALYELKGDVLQDLTAQAQHLCGGSFQVLRVYERGQGPRADGMLGTGWLTKGWAFLSAANRSPEDTRASMTVACDGTPAEGSRSP